MMCALPTFQFWDCNEKQLAVPLEWQTAVLEICNVDWQTAIICLQGQRLNVYQQVFAGQVRVLSQWHPVGAGHYQLLINQQPYSLTIEPHKIQPVAFQRLLEDLELALPIAVAIGLTRGGADIGVRFNAEKCPTLTTEYWQLNRMLQGDAQLLGMETWLPRLVSKPLQRLQSRASLSVPERARHPMTSQLTHWQRQPRRRLNDQSSDLSVDVYENQLLKLFLQQFAHRLQRLQRLVQGQLATKTESLAIRFNQLLASAKFLETVQVPHHFSARITPALAHMMPYRGLIQAYQYGQTQVSIHLQDNRLQAPLNNVPYLYQLWGSLQVMQSLLSAAVELGYQVVSQRLVMTIRGSPYVRILPDGQPVLVLMHPHSQRQIQFIPEQRYQRDSISFLQRPDITVAMTLPNNTKRVCLFDPKYRLVQESAKPTKADIDKMHAYRDAIRINGQAIVRYAAILYPGRYQHYTAGLEALPAYPGEHLILQQHLQRVFKTFLTDA